MPKEGTKTFANGGLMFALHVRHNKLKRIFGFVSSIFLDLFVFKFFTFNEDKNKPKKNNIIIFFSDTSSKGRQIHCMVSYRFVPKEKVLKYELL